MMFRIGDTSLENQGVTGCPFAIENQHPKKLVEVNPRQTIREISQIMGMVILTISDHLKNN